MLARFVRGKGGKFGPVRRWAPRFASMSTTAGTAEVPAGAPVLGISWSKTAGRGSYELRERGGDVLIVVADEQGLFAAASRLTRELRVTTPPLSASRPNPAVVRAARSRPYS